jgi:tRNA-dihydrouridine synthase B
MAYILGGHMKPVLHLAPLHGITNVIFRNAYYRHFKGFDCATAPFVISNNKIKNDNKLLKDLIPARNSGNVPLIPQILSKDPAEFNLLAENLKEMGYCEINWNLGCPFPMVADKKRGSGLLQYPMIIDSFLESICAHSGVEISLKIRLGRESEEEILELIPIFNRYPLKKIIIHPRTGIQMYEGNVNLDWFEKSAALIRHPIAYNGDIFSKETFDALQARFPLVNEWMIGRGALRNPFLPEILAGMEPDTLNIKRIRDFHTDLFDSYAAEFFGHAHVLDKMKEIWTYLGLFFHDSGKHIKKIHKSRNVDEFSSAVHVIFESGSADKGTTGRSKIE